MSKLKVQYDEACRIADQAEDELNFTQGLTSPPGRTSATLSTATEEKGKGKEHSEAEKITHQDEDKEDEIDTDDEKPAVVSALKGKLTLSQV